MQSTDLPFNQVEFAPITEVVSMRFGPYGAGQALYYVTATRVQIRRIAYTGTLNRNPVANVTANPTLAPLPLCVQFNGGGSTDPDNDPLTYEWDFQSDGTPDSTTCISNSFVHQRGVFFAKLTVRDGRGGENSTTIRIDAGNTPPVPTIETPSSSTHFAVGQHFILHGSAVGPEQGPPLSSSFADLAGDPASQHPYASLPGADDRQRYRDHRAPARRPRCSQHKLSRDQADCYGLEWLDPDHQPGTSSEICGCDIPDESCRPAAHGQWQHATGPATVNSWEGARLFVNAPNQTDSSGNLWAFNSWSDGGPASHIITTPASASTYTATFATSQFLSFTPSDDALHIDAGAPTSNFGSDPRLMVDNSPVRHSLLKFNISGIGSSTVAGAKLRLYCLDGSPPGELLSSRKQFMERGRRHLEQCPRRRRFQSRAARHGCSWNLV